ncbi:MAG: MFS transporter [Burkholderiales bacterium]
MFAPFSIRSFRHQWSADLLASWAAEMEMLILGWYVLTQTDSVLTLTVFASLQWMGTLFAPGFGLAGDRIGHRNVLAMMRACYVVLAAVIASLSVTGTLSPAAVLAVAALAGLVRPCEFAVRTVLTSEIVPQDRLMSAISLSRITTDSARAAGALAGAGAVALVGMTAAYAIVVALYVTSAALILRIPERERSAADAVRNSPWRDLLDAARAIREAPAQQALLLIAFLVNFTVFPFTIGLLPYVAREVYGVSQVALGYLAASAGIGAILASLLVSRTAGTVRPARMMITFAVAWHVLVIAFGYSTTLGVGLVLLALIGMCSALCMLPLALLMLRGAPPALRGRIMGIRTQAVYGLTLGLLAVGPLIERVGFRAAATLYGLLGLACVGLIVWKWRSHLWLSSAAGNAR